MTRTRLLYMALGTLLERHQRLPNSRILSPPSDFVKGQDFLDQISELYTQIEEELRREQEDLYPRDRPGREL